MLRELVVALAQEGVLPGRGRRPPRARAAPPHGVGEGGGAAAIGCLGRPALWHALRRCWTQTWSGTRWPAWHACRSAPPSPPPTSSRGSGIFAAGPPLRFAHPLVREAIYGDLPPAQRADGHARAARLLRAAGAGPERVGAQLVEAGPASDADAVASLREAAGWALRRGAPETAAAYLARALAEPPSPQLRGALLRELGSAGFRAGRPDAIAQLEQALQLAEEPAEAAACAADLGRALTMSGRFADAVAALERGADAVAGRDRELELALEGELGSIGQLDIATCARVTERLERVSVGLDGSTPGERLVLGSLAYSRHRHGASAEEVADLAERALAGGSLLRDQTSESAIVYELIYGLWDAERYDRADDALEATVADARRHGSVLGLSIALAVRAHIAWLAGRLRDAEADARSSTDAQLAAGWTAMLPLAATVAAECLAERGEVAEAEQLLRESGLWGELPGLIQFRWVLVTRARLHVLQGRASEGLADLLACDPDGDIGIRTSSILTWRSRAALVLAAQGERERARALADEEIALARRVRATYPLGVGLRTAGLLALESDAGLALLEQSVSGAR